jgi:hypothetical protein
METPLALENPGGVPTSESSTFEPGSILKRCPTGEQHGKNHWH